MKDKNLLKDIEQMQQSVKQMLQDDIQDNPEMAYEEFQCECCAKTKILAGSLVYDEYRLCNDCVLIAEVSLFSGKIRNIQQLMASMEDRRFETIYNELFQPENLLSPEKMN